PNRIASLSPELFPEFMSRGFNRGMKIWVVLLLGSLLVVSAEASTQINLPGFLKKLPGSGITESEAGQGIKEAVSQGTGDAIVNLHRTDGFFGNSLYKVLLPPDARKAEATLRKIGLGGQVDKAILSINRGAEDAVGSAGPIFTDAIKEMTLNDAL